MIYTTYFAKLRKLPTDIVPISISRFPPKNVHVHECKLLAPSPQLLRSYKATGDWNAYVTTYNNTVLSTLSPHGLIESLKIISNGQNFALVCFEKDYLHCHRSLVAEWLKSSGYEVKEF